MANLVQRIGDGKTHSIKLNWEGRPFEPGIAWNLIWTLKLTPESQSDANANIQKQYGTGITVTGSTASVSTIHYDTAGGTFTPEGEIDEVTLPALAPGSYYWDIQAQLLADPNDVRTVANGTLTLLRDVTRAVETAIPIYTENPSAPIQVPVPGADGADGADGAQGIQGIPGADGADGADGAQIISQATPPADLTAIWHDTIDNTLNYWDGNTWVTDSYIIILSPLVYLNPLGLPFTSPLGLYYTAPAA